jgi:MFS family permease
VLGFLLRFSTFVAFRYPQYRLLWYGQICTGLTFWMDQVTRGWLMYEMTNSALQLGYVTAIRIVPLLLLSPVAGVMADRYGRKLQLAVSESLNAGLYAVMAGLILSGQVAVWHVYAVAIATAMVQVFQAPAQQSMTSESVAPRELTNAIGLNSIAFNSSRTIGPAVAGVLIALTGTGVTYAVQAGLLVLATIWTLLLNEVRRSAQRDQKGATVSLFASAVEGWRFVFHNETVRAGMIVMLLAALLAQPFTTLLPIFAKDVLQAGSSGQGFLLTGMGAGALLSAVTIASLGDRLPKGILMVGGAMAYGMLLVAFAGSQWFPVSVLLMVLVGIANVCCNALVQTVVQGHSPAEIRGRVMGVFQYRDVFNTMGSLLMGALAALWGAQWALGAVGTVCTLLAVAIYFAIPHVRTIR